MRKFLIAGASAALLCGALTACPGTVSPVQNPTQSPAAFCQDLAATQADPILMAEVNQLLTSNPHSAFSVLYSEIAASCQGGVPVAGVSETWMQMVIGMVEALLPSLLPALVGVL